MLVYKEFFTLFKACCSIEWNQLTGSIKSIDYNFKTQIIRIALDIFKYLLSIHRIAKLQAILCIDCNSNTKTMKQCVCVCVISKDKCAINGTAIIRHL
jgi:hypothetical protein